MKKTHWAAALGRKLLILLVSIFVLSVAVFYVARLAPGDPLVSYYGERAEKMSVEERAWAEQMGLIRGTGQGDMAYQSFVTREQLAAVIYRLEHPQ